jgi:hypothetical protein
MISLFRILCLVRFPYVPLIRGWWLGF